MSDQPAPTLLQEIDARQNEVIDQLDELNARVEELLKQVTQRDKEAETSDETQASA